MVMIQLLLDCSGLYIIMYTNYHFYVYRCLLLIFSALNYRFSIQYFAIFMYTDNYVSCWFSGMFASKYRLQFNIIAIFIVFVNSWDVCKEQRAVYIWVHKFFFYCSFDSRLNTLKYSTMHNEHTLFIIRLFLK